MFHALLVHPYHYYYLPCLDELSLGSDSDRESGCESPAESKSSLVPDSAASATPGKCDTGTRRRSFHRQLHGRRYLRQYSAPVLVIQLIFADEPYLILLLTARRIVL